MKIDSTIEPMVREAFAASVAGEPERFETGVEAIAERGDEFTSRALALALAVDHLALLLTHSGQRPDDQQLDYLAGGLAEDAQHWGADITPASARSFLESLATGSSTTLSPGELVEIAFGAGGWLLSAFLPEGKRWTEFLDEIEDALETVEEPQ
jgi:hypothetical protein